jgi:plasmid stability protein
MAVVTLSNIDDNLFGRLRAAAGRRNTTVEDEIVETLRERFAAERRELVRRADEIAAMTPKGVRQTDGTLLVREDREDPDR